MDGLEINEIKLSEIISNNRIDPEYYQSAYVYNEQYLLSKPNFRISKYFKVTDGEHGSVEYLENGIKYLTAENIKHGFVDISNVRYVSKEVDRKNARARVETGDILISIKGTLGSIAVAEEELKPCNMNRDVAIIKPLSVEEKRNYYLALFLMSKYGLNQSMRGGSGGVQQMITLERLREFIIPELNEEMYDIFRQLVKKSQQTRKESHDFYNKAQELLIKELGLERFVNPNEVYSEKSFLEVFNTNKRLDAEYYQKKYDSYEKLIKSYSNGYDTIGNLCSVKDKNFIPFINRYYSYMELSNIGPYGNIIDADYIHGADLPTRARRKVTTGDVIVSSVEGSMSKCAFVEPDFDNFICSNGFYVVNSEKINSETLLVLFKSEVIQQLMKKGCSGTILMAISAEEFRNVPLPIIRVEIQQQIQLLINESIQLRRYSMNQLENAIKLVEMAIEQSEAEAINFYKKA